MSRNLRTRLPLECRIRVSFGTAIGRAPLIGWPKEFRGGSRCGRGNSAFPVDSVRPKALFVLASALPAREVRKNWSQPKFHNREPPDRLPIRRCRDEFLRIRQALRDPFAGFPCIVTGFLSSFRFWCPINQGCHVRKSRRARAARHNHCSGEGATGWHIHAAQALEGRGLRSTTCRPSAASQGKSGQPPIPASSLNCGCLLPAGTASSWEQGMADGPAKFGIPN